MSSEWIGILGVMVGAIITAIVTGLREFIHKWFERKERRAFLATRLICELEVFIDKCASVVSDPYMYTRLNEGERLKVARYEQPKFEPLNLEVDWFSIDSKIMHDTLYLPNKIRLVEELLNSIRDENPDPPEYEYLFETREYEFARLAIEAQDILGRVSEAAGLQKTARQYWFGPKIFVDKVKAIEKIRTSRDAEWEERLGNSS